MSKIQKIKKDVIENLTTITVIGIVILAYPLIVLLTFIDAKISHNRRDFEEYY